MYQMRGHPGTSPALVACFYQQYHAFDTPLNNSQYLFKELNLITYSQLLKSIKQWAILFYSNTFTSPPHTVLPPFHHRTEKLP